jgi:hypothetical protein
MLTNNEYYLTGLVRKMDIETIKSFNYKSQI